MPRDRQMIETEAREEWDSNPELREEFAGDFESYLAYRMAADNGQIRIAHHEVTQDGEVRRL